jgi:Ras-related GTP-binding protein A/B
MENYFKSQRDHIFRAVEVLIYVFDVTSKEREKVNCFILTFELLTFEQDVQYFNECLDAIKAKSPNAKIFCLIHKMDLVHSDEARNMVD